MVVVKLRKDRFGRPLFLKGSPMEYKGKVSFRLFAVKKSLQTQ